jgi:trehalose utilization protein
VVSQNLRVIVWNEFRHEKNPDHPGGRIYPEGMHAPIVAHLNAQAGVTARAATLDEPEHGLSEAALAETDVLIWWGHVAHHEVKEEVVARVHRRVLAGMGLIVLHSAALSPVFTRLVGTTGNLKWREADERERLWVVHYGHPITAGLGECIELDQEEMYGEPFDIPAPDELVFISWFQGGEVFRSGCCFHRGRGRIFYFRPGHESYPTYHNSQVLQVIANAVRWAAPVAGPTPVFGNAKPLESLS